MSDPTPTPPTWQQKYGPLLIRVAVVVASMLLGALAHWLGVPAPEPIVLTVEKEAPTPPTVATAPAVATEPGPFGWHNDPDEVEAVARTQPIRAFAATPAFAATTAPDHVYLWDAARKARGSLIPARNQGQVGSCVSFGCVAVVEHLQCVQIAGGKAELFRDLAQEVVYGGSRVQIGGGRIRGDGSTGAWAAQWCERYGVVARGTYGTIDLTSYSESRCRQFGSSGCPAALEPGAKERPVKSITQVRTAEECRSALANGYPVTVASSVGFGQRGPYVRDAAGFLRASGTWPHQMAIIGYVTGGRPGFLILNSWGADWVSGPKGAGDPPDGSFYADESTVSRMLGEGDSWAYSDLVGWPARKLDAFVDARPAVGRDNPFALCPRGEPCLAF